MPFLSMFPYHIDLSNQETRMSLSKSEGDKPSQIDNDRIRCLRQVVPVCVHGGIA